MPAPRSPGRSAAHAGGAAPLRAPRPAPRAQSKSKVILSMELVTGGSVLDEILASGCYSEGDSRVIFKQIAGALQYLHKQGIVHRDLKPENVMLASKDSRTTVKLTDFGLSKIFETQDPVMFSTVCGTPQYIPPEVLNVFDGNTEGYAGKNMDMYGLGTLLYILLSGTVPFHDKDEMELFRKIKTGTWEFYDAIWKSVSDEAKSVTAALMEVEPRERMTLEEALAHPWTNTPREPGAEAAREESPLKDDKELFPQISNLRVSTGDGPSSPAP